MNQDLKRSMKNWKNFRSPVIRITSKETKQIQGISFMEKDYKLTKKQCELLDIEYETDPEVQKEMDLLDSLNKKYSNEITYEDTDQVDIEALYRKKQKEMDKMVSMYRDFDPEDIIITKNETGLENVQFF